MTQEPTRLATWTRAMQDSVGAVRWAVRPPAELLALIDPCRDPDAPVGMQELRSAQAALQTHLQGTLQPALMQMSGSDSAASSDLLLSGLGTLSQLWQKEALRPLLTARHLPLELTGLLHLLHASGPRPGAAARAGSSPPKVTSNVTWCHERLEELLAHEPTLALLEALISLLRQPSSPSWLRTACSARLSQCVLRSDGVNSLLLSLCAHQPGEAAQAAAAQQAARLLGSVPARMTASAYVALLAPQLLPLLAAAPPSEDASPAPGQAAAPMGNGGNGAEAEAEVQQQRVLRNAAALVVSTLMRRQPEACLVHVLRPLLAPMAAADDDVGNGVDDCRIAIQRVCHLLTAKPPPPVCLCDALLEGGALPPLVSLGLSVHARHIAEQPAPDGATEPTGAASTLVAVSMSDPALVALAERGIEALVSLTSLGVGRLAQLVISGCEDASEDAKSDAVAAPTTGGAAGPPLHVELLTSYLARRLGTRQGGT